MFTDEILRHVSHQTGVLSDQVYVQGKFHAEQAEQHKRQITEQAEKNAEQADQHKRQITEQAEKNKTEISNKVRL